jgi:hypothetical protein
MEIDAARSKPTGGALTTVGIVTSAGILAPFLWCIFAISFAGMRLPLLVFLFLAALPSVLCVIFSHPETRLVGEPSEWPHFWANFLWYHCSAFMREWQHTATQVVRSCRDFVRFMHLCPCIR